MITVSAREGGNGRNDEGELKNDLSSKYAKRSLKSICFRVTLERVEVSGGVMVRKKVGGLHAAEELMYFNICSAET